MKAECQVSAECQVNAKCQVKAEYQVSAKFQVNAKCHVKAECQVKDKCHAKGRQMRRKGLSARCVMRWDWKFPPWLSSVLLYRVYGLEHHTLQSTVQDSKAKQRTADNSQDSTAQNCIFLSGSSQDSGAARPVAYRVVQTNKHVLVP